jgi:hypothetical protein
MLIISDIEARLEESNAIVLEREKCIEKKVDVFCHLIIYINLFVFRLHYFSIIRKAKQSESIFLISYTKLCYFILFQEFLERLNNEEKT